MLARPFLRLVIPLSVLGIAPVACGSSGSEFENGGASNGGPGSGSNGGLGGPNGNSTSGGASGSGGPGCSAQLSIAERKPAHLFFILDQSFSMVSPDAQRWPTVTTAFKAFLNDPLSKGVSASLEMFPTRTGDKCVTGSYNTLDVGMTALAGGPGGSSAFDAPLNLTPSFETASTPTRFVLLGVGPIAKSHAQAHPDVKTAIVLMTDGKPQGCSDNSIQQAADAAGAVADAVPTYVIGIATGAERTDLEANLALIATAGRSGLPPFLIQEGSNPADTATKFREAIDTIRGRTTSCELDIPTPPAGETLDLQKVNVSFTTGGGAKEALSYDEACGAAGWKFDSTATPKKVVLCNTTCNTFKADPKGVVGVEFGCDRRNLGLK
jgi:hypothetical protein